MFVTRSGGFVWALGDSKRSPRRVSTSWKRSWLIQLLGRIMGASALMIADNYDAGSNTQQLR
jgi:hypothetical protein